MLNMFKGPSIPQVPRATTYVPYEMEGMAVTTGEFPKGTYDNPASYGHEFNLIRAVKEFGPERIEAITKRLADLDAEAVRLHEERATLEALVEAATRS